MHFKVSRMRVEVLADPSCDEGVTVVRVRLDEQGVRVCETGQYQELSGDEKFPSDLVTSCPERI